MLNHNPYDVCSRVFKFTSFFAIYCNVIFHSGSVNIINVYNDMHENAMNKCTMNVMAQVSFQFYNKLTTIFNSLMNGINCIPFL